MTATDALGETTTTAYTPAGAGPLTQVTVTNPAGHVTTSRLNPAWGAKTEAVAPNQARTLAEFDPLGRRTAVWLPERDSSESASLRVSYDISQTEPTTVTTESMIWDGSYLTEVALYDSLLRHRQTQAETYGGRLISQTVYDSHGRVRSDSEPVFNNQSGPTGRLVWVTRNNDVARTEYGYDAAGRVSHGVHLPAGGGGGGAGRVVLAVVHLLRRRVHAELQRDRGGWPRPGADELPLQRAGPAEPGHRRRR